MSSHTDSDLLPGAVLVTDLKVGDTIRATRANAHAKSSLYVVRSVKVGTVATTVFYSQRRKGAHVQLGVYRNDWTFRTA